MYKTILAAMDGSKRAEAILPHLENLAKSIGSKVIFMQVIEDVRLGFDEKFTFRAKEHYELIKKLAEDYLEVLRTEFRKKGIDAQILVSHGPIVEAIINAAERENADLITIASHGRTGLFSVFYGSVAAGVLHRVDRPLLLIRSIEQA